MCQSCACYVAKEEETLLILLPRSYPLAAARVKRCFCTAGMGITILMPPRCARKPFKYRTHKKISCTMGNSLAVTSCSLACLEGEKRWPFEHARIRTTTQEDVQLYMRGRVWEIACLIFNLNGFFFLLHVQPLAPYSTLVSPTNLISEIRLFA